MLIDGPQADRAAAGQRHARLACARDQRSEREDRCAHRLHELVRRERPVDRRRVERHGAGFAGLHVDAHLREQRLHRLHVVQPRHVGQRQRLGREQRRAQDRQGSVLRARDAHFAAERGTAFDQQLVHGVSMRNRGSIGGCGFTGCIAWMRVCPPVSRPFAQTSNATRSSQRPRAPARAGSQTYPSPAAVANADGSTTI